MEAADKLLERMRDSKAGWGEDDLEELYVAFGFQFREGGHHRIYYHPKYRQLYATVARHRSLAKGYISTAVKIIDQLKQLEKNDE